MTLTKVEIKMKWFDEFIGRQIRKPSGVSGWLLGHQMAKEHRALVDWMVECLNIEPTNHVLDVGCGGGMTLRTMCGLAPDGFVAGIDYSPIMVRQAQKRNRAAVQSGCMEITLADVTSLPYDDNRFDIVSGVETFYFWPDPLCGLREILRVLKPGGRIALVVDISKPSPDAAIPENVGERFDIRVLSGEEIKALLVEAGFVDVTFKERPERAKGWLCVYGSKPARD